MHNILINEFFKRPIAYQPALAKAFGSVNLGILWSQLFYWNDRTTNPEGWIYKTSKDLYEETGLSRKEQETARKIGRELGVLEEKLSGCPATIHYRINVEVAIEILEKFLQNKQTGQLPIFKEKKNTNSIAYLKNLPAQDIAELMEKYSVGEKFVRARAEDVIDYCEAKGKSYKDYKAALRNFIKTTLQKSPDQKIKRPIAEVYQESAQVKERTPEQQAKINEQLAAVRAKISKKLSM